jgi:tRNA-Thr(GGU) m(6)t(6)A37 methyltransferase TsaA
MSAPPRTLSLVPIGIVHSPLRDKRSAPRQPAAARGIEGRIELEPRTELSDALCDLERWSHIWVLFWFHHNGTWNPKVMPPRSNLKRGLFATRSPYRPNPIGLSVLRLLKVEGRVLHVADLDLLDQTPVLDIKPYVAYTDSVPSANAGWLGDEAPLDPGPSYHVEFTGRALEQLAWLEPRLPFDLRALASEALRLGPAPHAYRRIRAFERYSRIGVKDFRLYFTTEAQTLRIFAIESGYRASVLEDPRARATADTALDVHRAFVASFGTPELP